MEKATKRMAALERERSKRRNFLDFWPFSKEKGKGEKKKGGRKKGHRTREQQQSITIAKSETTGNHGGGPFSNYEGGTGDNNGFSCMVPCDGDDEDDDDFDFGFYDAFRVRRKKGGTEMRADRSGSGGGPGGTTSNSSSINKGASKEPSTASALFRARSGRNAAAEVQAVEMRE